MTFGPPQADLMPGAENAVRTCLSIQPGERVALIADEASAPVGEEVARAGVQVTEEALACPSVR